MKINKNKKIYVIGHITKDIKPERLGGSVSYIAIGLARLGYKVEIITKCPSKYDYLKIFKSFRIPVHNLPTHNVHLKHKITSFENIYTQTGARTQFIRDIAERLSPRDLAAFPKIEKGDLIIIAPVINEISLGLVKELSSKYKIILAIQGFLRSRSKEGRIFQKPFKGLEMLKSIEYIILSNEDITFNNFPDYKYLKRIVKFGPKVILTESSSGTKLFTKYNILNFKAYPLNKTIFDYTGAGDTFIAGFVDGLNAGLKNAILKGNIYAKLKLIQSNKNNFGFTLPLSRSQFLKFLANNKIITKSYYDDHHFIKLSSAVNN